MQAPFYQSIAALYRIMETQAAPMFKKHELSISHALLIVSICDQASISPGKLSAQHLLAPSTITRLIDKLEKKKLVDRKKVGKQIVISATEKGQQMKDELMETFEQLEKHYTAALGISLIEKLTNALQEVSVMLKEN